MLLRKLMTLIMKIFITNYPMRKVKMKCKICKGFEFEEDVEFGCFIYFRDGVEDKNSYVEIRRERRGMEDLFVRDVFCPQCGCCRDLEFI